MATVQGGIRDREEILPDGRRAALPRRDLRDFREMGHATDHVKGRVTGRDREVRQSCVEVRGVLDVRCTRVAGHVVRGPQIHIRIHLEDLLHVHNRLHGRRAIPLGDVLGIPKCCVDRRCRSGQWVRLLRDILIGLEGHRFRDRRNFRDVWSPTRMAGHRKLRRAGKRGAEAVALDLGDTQRSVATQDGLGHGGSSLEFSSASCSAWTRRLREIHLRTPCRLAQMTVQRIELAGRLAASRARRWLEAECDVLAKCTRT